VSGFARKPGGGTRKLGGLRLEARSTVRQHEAGAIKWVVDYGLPLRGGNGGGKGRLREKEKSPLLERRWLKTWVGPL